MSAKVDECPKGHVEACRIAGFVQNIGNVTVQDAMLTNRRRWRSMTPLYPSCTPVMRPKQRSGKDSPSKYLICCPRKFKICFPTKVEIEKGKVTVPVGHSGVMLIKGAREGTWAPTKYFEYGRYDRAVHGVTKLRWTKRPLIRGGRVDRASLAKVMAPISRYWGQRRPIRGAYIEVPGKFKEMLKYADGRLRKNSDKKRPKYHELSIIALIFYRGC